MSKLIAVVDDNEGFLDLVEVLFTEESYRVLKLSDQDSAYEMILREKPDLVILDRHLGYPDTGMTLLNLLQSAPVTAATPIIICTADIPFLRKNREYLLSRGCSIIEKPFNIEDMLAVVRDSLSNCIVRPLAKL